MIRTRVKLMALLAGVLVCGTAWALSVALPSPEIRFPQGFDQRKAEAVEAVLRDKQFKYVDGLYSHWPPAWSTTLVYQGDAKSLKAMIESLGKVNGMHVRVTFSKDLAKESGTGHSAGSWWVMYSHERPDEVQVRVNLAAVDVTELELNVARSGD